MKPYTCLSLAILIEVIATSLLNYSNGFRNLLPALISLVCYALSFYLLSKVLTVMSVGIVYALWAGVGIVLITLSAFIFNDQKVDLPAMLGIFFIIAGVVIIHLFSSSVMK